MDALMLLTADHNRVRGLFQRFEEAKEDRSTSEMSRLASTVFEELVVHTTIEEEIFYPWARDLSEEIAETVEESLQEHHVVKMLMDEANALEPASDEWTAKLKVLMENVEHHAEEEEQEQFPKVAEASGDDQREQLAARLEARKAELGAPTMADKSDLSTTALRQLAREQQIPGRSSMNREELAATVSPEPG